MASRWTFALPALAAAGLCACGAPDSADEPVVGTPPAAPAPPFRTEVPLQIVMRGPVTLAAEVYWDAVSIVVDINGIHENYPQNDQEWETVWAAGIALAESGNLLMLPERALDQGDWMRLANALVDVGLEAARAADKQDYEAVLDVGEKVYNVCTECHEIYNPSLQI